MDKENVIRTPSHTMEYHSTIKEKGILPFTTWMELEGIMLSEINETKRQINLRPHLYMNQSNKK